MGQAAGASTATLSSATPTLLAGLKQLRDDIERYGVEFPDVEGPDRLLKRAKKEYAVMQHIDGGSIELTPHRLQGCMNNLNGLRSEYDIATRAPGVVAINKRFSVAASETGGALDVEVDVVANGGHAWIEVKHIAAGVELHSQDWVGNPGHLKGLFQQATELLRVAAAPCHQVQWQAPVVVFQFMAGLPAAPTVAAMQLMGVHVVDANVDLAAVLPPPPPLPATINLDITAMCALVSEVTCGDPTAPAVAAWALTNRHRRECVQQELDSRLDLPAFIGTRPLCAASETVARFEKILYTVGSAVEQQRWQQRWSPRVRRLSGARSTERVRSLGLSPAQAEAFGAGDCERAETLTANGRAVRSITSRGVALVTHCHRPVWLVGPPPAAEAPEEKHVACDRL